jgi:hypothetical protein
MIKLKRVITARIKCKVVAAEKVNKTNITLHTITTPRIAAESVTFEA